MNRDIIVAALAQFQLLIDSLPEPSDVDVTNKTPDAVLFQDSVLALEALLRELSPVIDS